MNFLKKYVFPFFVSFLLLISCSVASFAAPAVVPVSANLIGQLLVALGLMTGTVSSGFTWVGSGNPYVDSVFTEQISSLNSGIPVSSDVLGQLSGTVIPNDLYTTDGSDFFVGNKKITANDLFLNAKSLVGVSYDMPVNISGLLSGDLFVPSAWGNNYKSARFSSPVSSVGTNDYFVPYLTTSGFKSFVWGSGFNFSFASDNTKIVTSGYRFLEYNDNPVGTVENYNSNTGFLPYTIIQIFPFGSAKTEILTSDLSEPSNLALPILWSNSAWSVDYHRVSGIGDFVFDDITGMSLLQTSGVPSTVLSGDSSSLGGSIVQVKSDDDNNGSTPPVPQSPNNWDIWKSVTELISQINDGTVTNGGTTYEQFVNNNYNYVNVDINVPDTQNINLSGGLDISGKGDININIHEDISLPSAGNGDGFYNPSVTDVIGGLVSDNPFLDIVYALFKSIDPFLVSVFSGAISLMLVLALWKLIRG